MAKSLTPLTDKRLNMDENIMSCFRKLVNSNAIRWYEMLDDMVSNTNPTSANAAIIVYQFGIDTKSDASTVLNTINTVLSPTNICIINTENNVVRYEVTWEYNE